MKRMLLVGGGHTHVEVLRRFALDPPVGAEIVLVSPGRFTPYSGMLPGLVAGHYSFEEAHIDLERSPPEHGPLRHRPRDRARPAGAARSLQTAPVLTTICCRWTSARRHRWDIRGAERYGVPSAVERSSPPGATCSPMQGGAGFV
jgi:hypothetical protein